MTAGFFDIEPIARIPTWGWLIIGIPVRVSKTPTFVIVYVPSTTSSGFNSIGS